MWLLVQVAAWHLQQQQHVTCPRQTQQIHSSCKLLQMMMQVQLLHLRHLQPQHRQQQQAATPGGPGSAPSWVWVGLLQPQSVLTSCLCMVMLAS
jgi:hypothetical protein